MTDKATLVLIFVLLSWWAIDEYIEGEEFVHVMDEHHAHFNLVRDWREEWRIMVDTYLHIWEEKHRDCPGGGIDEQTL